MYIENDIIHGEPLSPRVTEVSTAADYKLILTFTNGERRMFDAKPLLSTQAFKPLNNKTLFESVKVAYGSIEWPHGMDYCPDTLYAESYPVVKAWDPYFAKTTSEEAAAIKRGEEEIANGEFVRHDDIDWN